jgi:alpha-D-xyloside xylohydrolase
MKQTNYYVHDVLAIPEGSQACVWRAGRPISASMSEGDIWLTVPFYKQKPGQDMYPDTQAPFKLYRFRVRAYGDHIIRLSIGMDTPIKEQSDMLELHPSISQTPLSMKVEEEDWIILDDQRQVRAEVHRRAHPIHFWSDLIPPPADSFELVTYPSSGLELSLSAYDQFQPNRPDALALAFVEEGGRILRTTLSFHAMPDECFAGTGERFAKMDLSGRSIQLENQDAQGVNNVRAYKNIPLYCSSRGYGVFIHTSAYTKLSLVHHSTRSTQVVVEEPLLDIFLLGGGSPERVLYYYRCLTGFPPPLPCWSYGIWMSRMSYFSAEEVEEVCRRLRAEQFPCDVIHLDTGWFRKDWLCEWTFNEKRFPDPAGFMARLREQGFRVSLWQLPYIAAGAKQEKEALENHFIAANRNRLEGGSNFSSNDYVGTIDFTSPQATRWYQSLLKPLLEMGAACIKADFGEDIHLDAEYENMTPEQLHNLYPLLYQRAVWEITKEVPGDGIAWSRSAWAGCQRYPLHWGGDAASSWDGMAGTLKGGLHFGLSGFGYWSHDIPGFHGVPDFMNSVIPENLYVRWTQMGVFTSHMRYHGTSPREPYLFPSIAPVIRRWFRLRYALIPYIMEQAGLLSTTGFPMLRALPFLAPSDKVVWHIDDEYGFGNDFLVAPILNPLNRRDVYLPAGQWVDFFTGERTTGPCWLKGLECCLADMPVWVRQGAVIPVYPEPVDCTDQMEEGKVVRLVIDDSFKGVDRSVIGPLLKGAEENR